MSPPPSPAPRRQPYDTEHSFASDVTAVSDEETRNLINLQPNEFHASSSLKDGGNRPPSTLQPLPKGAMAMPAPQTVYNPVSATRATQGWSKHIEIVA
jgi:hypothetical protein